MNKGTGYGRARPAHASLQESQTHVECLPSLTSGRQTLSCRSFLSALEWKSSLTFLSSSLSCSPAVSGCHNQLQRCTTLTPSTESLY